MGLKLSITLNDRQDGCDAALAVISDISRHFRDILVCGFMVTSNICAQASSEHESEVLYMNVCQTQNVLLLWNIFILKSAMRPGFCWNEWITTYEKVPYLSAFFTFWLLIPSFYYLKIATGLTEITFSINWLSSGELWVWTGKVFKGQWWRRWQWVLSVGLRCFCLWVAFEREVSSSKADYDNTHFTVVYLL